MGDCAQPAGHSQVDNDGGVVIEVDNEIFGAPADTPDNTSLDPGEDVFDPVAGQDAGKIADTQRTNTLTDDLVDQGAADGFDLGEFWHTRTAVARHKDHGGRDPERNTRPSSNRVECLKR